MPCNQTLGPNSACQQPDTNLRIWLHPPEGRLQSWSLLAHGPSSEPALAQGHLGRCSQRPRDTALPTKSRPPPRRAGPGHTLGWGLPKPPDCPHSLPNRRTHTALMGGTLRACSLSDKRGMGCWDTGRFLQKATSPRCGNNKPTRYINIQTAIEAT